MCNTYERRAAMDAVTAEGRVEQVGDRTEVVVDLNVGQVAPDALAGAVLEHIRLAKRLIHTNHCKVELNGNWKQTGSNYTFGFDPAITGAPTVFAYDGKLVSQRIFRYFEGLPLTADDGAPTYAEYQVVPADETARVALRLHA